MLETRTVVVSAQVLRRNDGDWVPSQIWGGALAQRSEWAGNAEKDCSLKARSVWGSRRFRASPSQKGKRRMSTLISAAHALCQCTLGRLLRRRGDVGWRGGSRALVAVLLERARMAALETDGWVGRPATAQRWTMVVSRCAGDAINNRLRPSSWQRVQYKAEQL